MLEDSEFGLQDSEFVPLENDSINDGFSSEEDDEATEQEAINLIQRQLTEISQLKKQIQTLEEQVSDQKLSSQQIEAQKAQIASLKHQIALFEARFESMEEERGQRANADHQFETQSESLAQERLQESENLRSQMVLKDQLVAKLQAESAGMQEEIRLTKIQVESREDALRSASRQTSYYQGEAEKAQATLVSREKLLQDRASKAKSKLQNEQKERKNCENRLKDLNQALQQRQEEIADLQKLLQEKEPQVRKMKENLDKARKQRDILDMKVPQMSQNIEQLQQMVDKMSIQVEQEENKRFEACKEREQSSKRLLTYEKIFEELGLGDNPIAFKKDFDAMRQDLTLMAQELQNRDEEIKVKDAKMSQRENELKTQKSRVETSLAKFDKWVKQNLTFENMTTGQVQENDTKMRLIFDHIPDKKTKMDKGCIELQGTLVSAAILIKEKCGKQSKQLAQCLEEIAGSAKLKNEIKSDFKNLQDKIELANEKNLTLSQRNEMLEESVKELQSEVHNQAESHYEKHQQMKKFFVECYNLLLNIRHKYVDSELIRENSYVDLSIKSDFNAVDSDLSPSEQAMQKSVCILELVNMVGNITNALNFELKTTTLKSQQIKELESQVESARMSSEKTSFECEKQLQKAKQDVQVSADRKIQRFKDAADELEQMNSEYKHKQDQLVNKVKQLKAELINQENLIEKLTDSAEQKQAQNGVLQGQIIPDLNKQVSSLRFQKDMLIKMSEKSKAQVDQQLFSLLEISKNVDTWLQSHDLESDGTQKAQIGNHGLSMFDSEIEEKGLQIDSLVSSTKNAKNLQSSDKSASILNPLQAKSQKVKLQQATKERHDQIDIEKVLKFRRAVIQIISINRLKIMAGLNNMSKNKNHQFKRSNGSKDLKQKNLLGQDSMIDFLLQGLTNIRIRYERIDLKESPEILHLLAFKVFGMKTKALQTINKLNFTLNQASNVINSLNATLKNKNCDSKDLEEQIAQISEKYLNMQNEHKKLLITFTKFQETHKDIKKELKDSIPMSEYNTLKSCLTAVNSQVDKMQSQFTESQSQTENLQQKISTLQTQKKEIHIKCMEVNEQLEDKERELELATIKVESLQEIIKKRENGVHNSQSQKAATNSTLKTSNEQLKKKVAELKSQIDSIQAILVKREDKIRQLESKLDCLSDLEKQRDKQAEIQKLLETNIETLETRCEGLEMQTENLKREKEALQQQVFLFEQTQNSAVLRQHLGQINTIHSKHPSFDGNALINQLFSQQMQQNQKSQPYQQDLQIQKDMQLTDIAQSGQSHHKNALSIDQKGIQFCVTSPTFNGLEKQPTSSKNVSPNLIQQEALIAQGIQNLINLQAQDLEKDPHQQTTSNQDQCQQQHQQSLVKQNSVDFSEDGLLVMQSVRSRKDNFKLDSPLADSHQFQSAAAAAQENTHPQNNENENKISNTNDFQNANNAINDSFSVQNTHDTIISNSLQLLAAHPQAPSTSSFDRHQKNKQDLFAQNSTQQVHQELLPQQRKMTRRGSGVDSQPVLGLVGAQEEILKGQAGESGVVGFAVRKQSRPSSASKQGQMMHPFVVGGSSGQSQRNMAFVPGKITGVRQRSKGPQMVPKG